MRITKKQVVVVSPLALLGIAGIAYANSLGVTSDILGGGTDEVENNCSIAASYKVADAANVAWTPFKAAVAADDKGTAATDDDVAAVPAKPAGYYLKSVTVTPTGTHCTDATFRLTVAGTGDAQLSEHNGQLTGAVQSVTLDKPVLVDNVTDLFAVVTKAAS